MFKLVPHQTFISTDRATAVVQAQQWLAEQSEAGTYTPLHIVASGTPGHITLSGGDPRGWIVFTRKDQPQ